MQFPVSNSKARTTQKTKPNHLISWRLRPNSFNHHYSFHIILVAIFDNRFLVAITLFLLKNTILRIVEHWILGTFAMKKSHLSVKKRTLHVSLL